LLYEAYLTRTARIFALTQIRHQKQAENPLSLSRRGAPPAQIHATGRR